MSFRNKRRTIFFGFFAGCVHSTPRQLQQLQEQQQLKKLSDPLKINEISSREEHFFQCVKSDQKKKPDLCFDD